MDNIEEAYRISRTGYMGTDAIIAIGLDELHNRLITSRPIIFEVWAIRDSNGYRVMWTRADVLIDIEGIPVTVADFSSRIQAIADEILEQSDAINTY